MRIENKSDQSSQKNRHGDSGRNQYAQNPLKIGITASATSQIISVKFSKEKVEQWGV